MNHYKNNCVFCKVAQRKVEHFQFWEDKKHMAFLDIAPQAVGHTLVIPKNHVNYVFKLHGKDYLSLFASAEKVATELQKLTKCKRVVMTVYGFEVPHTHVHLIPMNSIKDVGKKIKIPTRAEMQKFADKMKKKFAK